MMDVFTTIDPSPPTQVKVDEELLPLTIGLAEQIQGQVFRKPMVLLLDSGSTTTWINKKALPRGIQGETVDKITGSTLGGTFNSTEQVCIEELSFPEFFAKRKLPKLSARVFHADCRYDMIVGRDVLRAFGVLLDFEGDQMQCDGSTIPMRTFPTDTASSGNYALDFLLNEYIDRAENDETPISDDLYGDEILVVAAILAAIFLVILRVLIKDTAGTRMAVVPTVATVVADIRLDTVLDFVRRLLLVEFRLRQELPSVLLAVETLAVVVVLTLVVALGVRPTTDKEVALRLAVGELLPIFRIFMRNITWLTHRLVIIIMNTITLSLTTNTMLTKSTTMKNLLLQKNNTIKTNSTNNKKNTINSILTNVTKPIIKKLLRSKHLRILALLMLLKTLIGSTNISEKNILSDDEVAVLNVNLGI